MSNRLMVTRCRHNRRVLSRMVDRELPAAERSVIEEHLSTCSVCRAELKSLEQDRAVLSAMPPVEPPSWLVTRVMAAVSKRREVRPARWVLGRAWGVAAAVLLIAAGLGVGAFLGAGIARSGRAASRGDEELLLASVESGTLDVYETAIGGD